SASERHFWKGALLVLILPHWPLVQRVMARSAVCTSPPNHRGATKLGDRTTSLCHLHRLALSSTRMVFPITAMPMLLNCFCLSSLMTPLSRRGSLKVLLIYPHG